MISVHVMFAIWLAWQLAPTVHGCHKCTHALLMSRTPVLYSIVDNVNKPKMGNKRDPRKVHAGYFKPAYWGTC